MFWSAQCLFRTESAVPSEIAFRLAAKKDTQREPTPQAPGWNRFNNFLNKFLGHNEKAFISI